MDSNKVIIRSAIAAAFVSLGIALYQRSEGQKSNTTIQTLELQHLQLQNKVRGLETNLADATSRLQISEQKSAELLVALGKASAAQPAPAPAIPITHAYVDSRYKRAKELAKSGNHTEALTEFLWCYDEGMRRVTAFGGVRQSFLLSDIVKLGQSYPPALTALRERRDEAQRLLATEPDDHDAASTFSSVNTALKESAHTLHYYDELALNNPARKTLAPLIYDELAGAQRYQEAVQAKPFKQMLSLFEDVAEPPPLSIRPISEKTLASMRSGTVKFGAGFVEVLAGAGQLTDARDLIDVILAYDSSPETRATLQRSVVKAGQPHLLESSPTP